jgi:hypothetical protein
MTRHRGVKAPLQGYRAPLSRCTLSLPPRDDEPGGVSLLPSPLPYACPKAVVTQKSVEQQVYEIFRLGRVDELFDDNPHGNEMYQSQKGLAQFLIPRGNASKLLEIVEEPFDLLTELVEVFIIV